jgi:hypothetical protein
VDAEGRRTPALRFGDPRVMALAGALCQTLLAATGFTNKNLRVLITGLLGSAYTPRYDTKLWMRDLMEGAAYLPK